MCATFITSDEEERKTKMKEIYFIFLSARLIFFNLIIPSEPFGSDVIVRHEKHQQHHLYACNLYLQAMLFALPLSIQVVCAHTQTFHVKEKQEKWYDKRQV